ncbi:MAG: DUF642 domain-containing protein [Rhodoferax sp.]|nr:DUF642 domain-containing protein [Rhodoferax sp.]
MASANMVINGDFESPNAVTISCYQNSVAGSWTSFGPGGNLGSGLVESGYSTAGLTWPVARSGTQGMFVNYKDFAGTKVAQTISLTANTSYQLSFSLAGINGDAGVPSVDVTLGNGVGTRNFTSAANASWSDLTWNFTALTTGSTILSFTAMGGPVNIDAVVLSVSPVPELSPSAMMAAGLVVLGGLALRRRSLNDRVSATRLI